MATADRSKGVWGRLLLLEEVRAAARRPFYRVLVATSAVLYVFMAMYVGQMIGFFPTGQTGTDVILLTSGPQWWNYPGLIAIFPNGFVSLPFFSTLVMILVSVGVGLGMGAAVYLSVQLYRRRGQGSSSSAAGGGVAGLTPALLSLVTLGACCSTTAAATAGLTWTAAASGTSLNGLLYYSWYPGVFQLSVLYVALVAQEQLLHTYHSLFAPRRATPPEELADGERARPWTRWGMLGLRIALLVGGTTWLLAVPAEWTWSAAPALSGALVAQVVLQHAIPSLLALGVALAPTTVSAWWRARAGRWARWGPRGLLAIAGISLLGWMPGPWAQAGLVGFGNELVGAAGLTGAWGGVAPPFGGISLAFRWGVQFLLLGGFAIAFAAVPERLVRGFDRSLSPAPAPSGWNSPDPMPSSAAAPPPPAALPAPAAPTDLDREPSTLGDGRGAGSHEAS